MATEIGSEGTSPNAQVASPVEVAEELLRRFSTQDYPGVLELYADDAVVSIMFWLPEPMVMVGKESFVAAMKAKAKETDARFGHSEARMYADIQVRDMTVHQTTDPNVVITEWTYVSRIGDSVVENANIVVMEVRDGKIVMARDYHNHPMRAVASGAVGPFIENLERAILPQDRQQGDVR